MGRRSSSLVRSATPSPAQPIDIHPSTVGFALGGVGLALEGGALGLYLWNRNRGEQAKAERARLTQNPKADGYFDGVTAYNQRADSIHTVSVATIGLAVAGGVALAGGIYLWRRDRPQTTAALAFALRATSGLAVGPGAGLGRRGVERHVVSGGVAMHLGLGARGCSSLPVRRWLGCVEVPKLDPGPFVIDDFDDGDCRRERKGSESGRATGGPSTHPMAAPRTMRARTVVLGLPATTPRR